MSITSIASKHPAPKESSEERKRRLHDNLLSIYRATPIARVQTKASIPRGLQTDVHQSSAAELDILIGQDESLCFRLLEVQQELTPSDKVICVLKQTSLNTCGHYYALSYAWGEGQAFETVIINGVEVQVSKHLEAFLRRAGKSLYHMPIWIDALCINQVSITERNHQVNVMDQIYSRARKVLVWLGSGNESFAYLFNMLNLLQTSNNRPHESEMVLLLGTIRHFLYLPYWSRAWIVQELLLARSIKLIYDEDSIEWNDFWRAVEECMYHSKMPYLDLASTIKLTRGYQHHEQREKLQKVRVFTMAEAIAKYSFTACVDIRDRIFAMLSLVQNASVFRVDYAWSPAQVVLRTYAHFGGDVAHLKLLMRILMVSGRDLVHATPQARLKLMIDPTSIYLSNRTRLLGQDIFSSTALQKSSHVKFQRLKPTKKPKIKSQSIGSNTSFYRDSTTPKCWSCDSCLPLKIGSFSYVFQYCFAKGKYHGLCVRRRWDNNLHTPMYVFMLLAQDCATFAVSEDAESLAIIHFQAQILLALQLKEPQLEGYFISLPWGFLTRLSENLPSSKTTENFLSSLQEVAKHIEESRGTAQLNNSFVGHLVLKLMGPSSARIMDPVTATKALDGLLATEKIEGSVWKDYFATLYWKPHKMKKTDI